MAMRDEAERRGDGEAVGLGARRGRDAEGVTAIDVAAWLAEDVGDGDVTSLAVIDEDAACEAELRLKEPGVVCGLEAAAAVFQALGARLDPLAAEGDVVEPGPVARVSGPARAVLSGERLALNLVGRLSGIATASRRYVDAVSGTGVQILDTRKTTPGLRALEKHAVRCGGGTNHRLGLDDGILIKDNHRRVAGSLGDAVRRARGRGVAVEVECDTLDQVGEAVAAGADRILLDNMSPPMLARAVALVGGRAELEASGGVTLETVREIAETGVDFVSVGALTHSVRSLDVSMEVL
jgi:nicotinate-nucleotide pyrophosphorylase (carboxylating)